MDKNSLLRMEWFIENYISILDKKVLDVGSYDVNGSYKHLFPASRFDYVGLDVCDGPNVDIAVKNPYKWSEVETDSFDVVISGQTLEHVEFFWITMSEMTRVLKCGGTMFIIVPRGFIEHRHPVDCYRFLADGMVALARYCNLFIFHASTNLAPTRNHKKWYSHAKAHSMLIALKPYSGETRIVNVNEYKMCYQNNKGFEYPLIAQRPQGFFAKAVKKIMRILNII